MSALPYHIACRKMTDKPLTAGCIAKLVGGCVEGDDSVQIDSIAALDTAGRREVTFAADNKRAAKLTASKAAAAIVACDARIDSAPMPLIRVENVQAAVAILLGYLSRPEDLPPVGIAETAVIAPEAELADDVRVGPGVTVAARAKIGRGSALCANVSIGSDVEIGQNVLLCEGVVVRQGCRVGNRVRIGPNSVVGYDGFGYYHAEGVHHKIPHIGTVVIEDDVEIGACSCVDRAKFGCTRIGAGSKIDNLVQVAHNVQIGRGCLLAALVGIAGSSKLGEYVTLGGHASIIDNVSVGSGVMCGGYTGVIKDVPDGQRLFGVPAIPAKEKFRQIRYTAKLPELVKRIAELEKRLSAIESSEDH